MQIHSLGSVLKKTRFARYSDAPSLTLYINYEHIQYLQDLARKDGIYRIRSPVKIGESFDKDESVYVSTFVKAVSKVACLLRDIAMNLLSVIDIQTRDPCIRTKKLRILRLKLSVMHHLNKNLLQSKYWIRFLICGLY